MSLVFLQAQRFTHHYLCKKTKPPHICEVSSPSSSTAIIPITPKSSLRNSVNHQQSQLQTNEPRCLIVGRQVSSVDVRIDHKSISRRHAALYYLDSGELVLKDCGGKHGTYVVNTDNEPTRLTKLGTAVLRDGDRLRFGNCLESLFAVKIVDSMTSVSDRTPVSSASTETPIGTNDDSGAATPVTRVREEIQVQSSENKTDNEKNINTTVSAAGNGLSGRAKREAEIAAMTSSLSDNIAYTVYKNDENNNPNPSNSATNSTDTTKSDQPNNSNGNQNKLYQKLNIPVSHEVKLTGHSNKKSDHNDTIKSSYRITALTLDPAGSRMISGCSGMMIKLWDFGGMDQRHRAFRTIGPVEDGHPIVDVACSNSGDRFVVATTSAQPMVFDRDGHALTQFAKGDVYVRDQSKTKGHTAAITGVSWHPLQPQYVLTGSSDGSARIWDLQYGKISFEKLVCDRVYRAKNKRGHRTSVSSISYHPAGRCFVLGTTCSSLQIWACTTNKGAGVVKNRPEVSVYDAHDGNATVTSVVYSPDGSKIASRADDDTVRIWKSSIHAAATKLELMAIYRSLPGFYDSCNVAFGPLGNMLCAGTCVKPQMGASRLKVFAANEDFLEKENKGASKVFEPDPLIDLVVSEGASVMRVTWHKRLNQIFCGVSDGTIRIYYDPHLSTKGALLSTSRSARKQDALELLLQSRHNPQTSIQGTIVAPNALPMYQDPEHNHVAKRKRQDRKDPMLSKCPEAPSDVKHMEGGRSSASTTFTQFVVQSTNMVKNKNIIGQDPRKDLFQYTEGKKIYAGRAYEGNNPEGGNLAETTAEQAEEDMKNAKKKKI